MANTTGYRDTNTVESTILARDIRSAILEYDKNVTPLLVITSNIGVGSQETANPKVEWYDEDREVRRDTSTTTGTGTTLAVTDGTLWKPEEVWRNTRTGEGFRVVSVATNNVTVVRNIDAAGAVACVSGDEYLKVGVAKMEGDTEREAYGGNPTARFNYTQIFERTYAMTRTAQNTANYTAPHDWDRRARKAMSEFKMDKEMAYLFGPGPGLDVTGAHPRRYMRGLHPSITTNVTDFAGTMTESEFWDSVQHGVPVRLVAEGRDLRPHADQRHLELPARQARGRQRRQRHDLRPEHPEVPAQLRDAELHPAQPVQRLDRLRAAGPHRGRAGRRRRRSRPGALPGRLGHADHRERPGERP
jgi:hypothetical protein